MPIRYDSIERFGADPPVTLDPLRPLRRHASFIAVFVLSAMPGAFALTYAYADRYRAELILRFKPSDVMRLSNHISQALGSPFPTANLPFKVIPQTITGLADSDVLLRRVVTELNLDAPAVEDLSGPGYIHKYEVLKSELSRDGSEAWQLLKWGRLIEEDPVAKAIAELRRGVRVRSDDSYLFSVQVTAKSPSSATAIADEVGAILMELVYSDDEAALKSQVGQLGKLRADKLEEIKAVSAQIERLLATNQLASVQPEIEKATERASLLAGKRTDTLADLRQGEGRLARLTDKLRPYDPLSGGHALDTPGVRRSPGLTPDDYNKLYTDKLTDEVANNGLRTRLDAVEQSIAATQQRLLVLNQVSAAYDQLSVQLQGLKRDYVSLTDAYQEMQISAASARSELKVQADAKTVGVPVSPIKIYHVAASGLVALMITIGLAFVLDYFDTQLFVLGRDDGSDFAAGAPLTETAD